MATKYCEFEPTQHRNKRVALFVFLDSPSDPHPLAICDVCTTKLKQMRPDAIVMTRKEFEAKRKEDRKNAPPRPPPKPADQAPSSSSASDAPSSNTS